MRLAECEAETICNLGKGSEPILNLSNFKKDLMDRVDQRFWNPSFRKGEL